MTTISLLTALT